MKERVIQGIGTDIIEIERIQKAIERWGQLFLNRLFTKKEQQYCLQFADPYPRFAGRFAGKEAVVKAFAQILFDTRISWKEIEILNTPEGKPDVYLSSNLEILVPGGKVGLPPL